MLAEGSYHELQTSNLDFTKLLRSPTEKIVAKKPELAPINPISANSLNQRSVFHRQLSIESVASSIDNSEFVETPGEPPEVAETQTSGNVSLNVYASYFFAGGNKLKVFFFVFICIFAQVLGTCGDLWMTYW